MISNALLILLGAMIGAPVGFFAFALCSAAKGDDHE